LYKKFRTPKGIYYPLFNYGRVERQKPQHSHKHAAVVNSKTYGREVYGNIDIWPDDDTVKARLIEKFQELSLSEEEVSGTDILAGDENICNR
jgi:hypothetical protein